MKLNKKAIKNLIASGCDYDEAVRLVQNGVRIKRIEEMRSKREGSRRSPRAQK